MKNQTILTLQGIIAKADDKKSPAVYVLEPVPEISALLPSVLTAELKSRQHKIETNIRKQYRDMQNNKYNVAFRNYKGRKK